MGKRRTGVKRSGRVGPIEERKELGKRKV